VCITGNTPITGDIKVMTRLSFKTTHRAKGVMQAVAELKHEDVGDLIHEYFYQLAKDDLAFINTSDKTDDELLDIFHEAIML
jgi:hypothetical protein